MVCTAGDAASVKLATAAAWTTTVSVVAARHENTLVEKNEEPNEEPRIYAKSRFVWIYADPDARRQWIGYLRTGGSVRLKSTRPRVGPGCMTAFYAIEPTGYVCADGNRATLDANDVVATCDYGGTLNVAFRRGNVAATQFHPEKSGRDGLALLGRFVREAALAHRGA